MNNGFIDFKVEDIKTYDITSCNQLISLYDMLQFYTKPFLSILDSLTILFSYLHSISLIDHKSTQKLERNHPLTNNKDESITFAKRWILAKTFDLIPRI